jgi:hypothetical protein
MLLRRYQSNRVKRVDITVGPWPPSFAKLVVPQWEQLFVRDRQNYRIGLHLSKNRTGMHEVFIIIPQIEVYVVQGCRYQNDDELRRVRG